MTSQQKAQQMLEAFWRRRAIIRSLEKQWAPLPCAELTGRLVKRTGLGVVHKI